MRTLLLAAMTVPGLVLLQAQPASATWSCDGPEVVCGKPSSAMESRYSYRPAPTAKKKAAVRHRHVKQKSATRSHKARSHRSAARSDQRSRRAHRPTRERSYESYAGGGSSYQSGMASYYWQGQQVASGGRFNPNGMTAAHRTLPFGTKVRVTHARTGRSVVVTINDRGPFIKGRVIDLSRGAASALGIISAGVASVQLAVVGR